MEETERKRKPMGRREHPGRMEGKEIRRILYHESYTHEWRLRQQKNPEECLKRLGSEEIRIMLHHESDSEEKGPGQRIREQDNKIRARCDMNGEGREERNNERSSTRSTARLRQWGLSVSQ